MRGKQKRECDHGVLHLRDTQGLLCESHNGSPASRGEFWANESQATTGNDYLMGKALRIKKTKIIFDVVSHGEEHISDVRT